MSSMLVNDCRVYTLCKNNSISLYKSERYELIFHKIVPIVPILE